MDSYHQYLHRDHLGSIVAKTTDQEPSLNFLANGAWGERRFMAWDGPADPDYDPVNARGYTNHEHLDPVGLIHMNGRVYDPQLGRFLSPDPLVQAPYNSQSYNRYSYVFNNPLSYTDPTGYQAEDDEHCGQDAGMRPECTGEAAARRAAEEAEIDGYVSVVGHRSGWTSASVMALFNQLESGAWFASAAARYSMESDNFRRDSTYIGAQEGASGGGYGLVELKLDNGKVIHVSREMVNEYLLYGEDQAAVNSCGHVIDCENDFRDLLLDNPNPLDIDLDRKGRVRIGHPGKVVLEEVIKYTVDEARISAVCQRMNVKACQGDPSAAWSPKGEK